MPNQQPFGYIEKGIPGLNQNEARINVTCSMTQSRDAGEDRICGPMVSNQALSHYTLCAQQIYFLHTGYGYPRFYPGIENLI